MGKYKNLLVNIGLFTLNTVSTKLITFLLVPLCTYFLTTAQYGVTDMSLTVASLGHARRDPVHRRCGDPLHHR